MYQLALSAATPMEESGLITTGSGPPNLAIAAFIFGAILLLVGFLGGQFKISAFEMSGRVTLGVINDVPLARHDLLAKGYAFGAIQTTRIVGDAVRFYYA